MGWENRSTESEYVVDKLEAHASYSHVHLLIDDVLSPYTHGQPHVKQKNISINGDESIILTSLLTVICLLFIVVTCLPVSVM